MKFFNRFDYKFWLVLLFVALYSAFVFGIDYTFEHYTEILGATVFFFALFAGFFISRQNDRYSKVSQAISETDGLFSYLYRISGLVPAIQTEVREIIRSHYEKIYETGNWAYHVLNPSSTITDLTRAFSRVNDEELKDLVEAPAMSGASEVIWDVLLELQLKRKRILILYNEKLLLFQWGIIYILGLLLVVSFNFIPTPEGMIVEIMKIIFATSVFLVIILLKQLNDLSLFGRGFSKRSAKDVFRILDEKDAEELGRTPEAKDKMEE